MSVGYAPGRNEDRPTRSLARRPCEQAVGAVVNEHTPGSAIAASRVSSSISGPR